MLVRFLEFREKLKKFYSRYDRYLLVGLKFLMTFIGLVCIQRVGQTWSMKGMLPLWTSLLLSLACGFLPAGTISFVFCGVLLLQSLTFSLEVFVVLALLLLLMILLYYSLRPHHGVLLGAALVLCFVGAPQLLCLLVGLFVSPFAAIPVCFGVLLGQFVENVAGSLAALDTEAAGFSVPNMVYLLTEVFTDTQLYVQLVAVYLTIVIVYALRRRNFSFARYAAVIAGGLVWAAVRLAGMVLTGQVKALLEEVLITLVCMVLVVAVSVFVFAEDYSRVEYVEFEDDEYYYYVKAVPKAAVSPADTMVKKINAQTKPEDMEATKTFEPVK